MNEPGVFSLYVSLAPVLVVILQSVKIGKYITECSAEQPSAQILKWSAVAILAVKRDKEVSGGAQEVLLGSPDTLIG